MDQWDSSIKLIEEIPDLPSELSVNYKELFSKVLKSDEYDLILTELVNKFKDKFKVNDVIIEQ